MQNHALCFRLVVQQTGRIHVAAFTDDVLHAEMMNKATFWLQTSFFGVDLTSLYEPAMDGYFSQAPFLLPIVFALCYTYNVKRRKPASPSVGSGIQHLFLAWARWLWTPLIQDALHRRLSLTMWISGLL